MGFPLHTVNVIGAGNVATHLAKALHQSGFIVKNVYSRSLEKAEVLGRKVSAKATDRLDQVEAVDITLVAVPDDAIAQVVSLLPSDSGLVLHTSGSMGLEVFGKRKKVGIFYPLQTFSSKATLDFEQVPIIIDGNSPVEIEQVKQLAQNLGNKTFRLKPDQKQWLHLNAVLVNNFTNHLFSIAKESSESHGIPFELYSALMTETVAKALRTSPDDAQTGPAHRGDQGVIRTHLELLKEDPVLFKLYSIFSENIQKNKNKSS